MKIYVLDMWIGDYRFHSVHEVDELPSVLRELSSDGVKSVAIDIVE